MPVPNLETEVNLTPAQVRLLKQKYYFVCFIVVLLLILILLLKTKTIEPFTERLEPAPTLRLIGIDKVNPPVEVVNVPINVKGVLQPAVPVKIALLAGRSALTYNKTTKKAELAPIPLPDKANGKTEFEMFSNVIAKEQLWQYDARLGTLCPDIDPDYCISAVGSVVSVVSRKEGQGRFFINFNEGYIVNILNSSALNPVFIYGNGENGTRATLNMTEIVFAGRWRFFLHSLVNQQQQVATSVIGAVKQSIDSQPKIATSFMDTLKQISQKAK